LAPRFFRLRRVFELLAHRDAMAEGDQLLQIVVGPLHRDAAHRNIFAPMLASLRQHDAERPRRNDGILEKKLVEVAHPIKKQTIGIGRLDLDILCDHWRSGVAGFLACFLLGFVSA